MAHDGYCTPIPIFVAHQCAAMTKYLLPATIILLSALFTSGQVTVKNLLTENRPSPIGIDTRTPRFSWQLDAADRNELQTAYEINVSTRENGKGSLWNSGKVTSGQSLQIPYAGPSLQSGQKYYWSVRVWDNKGRISKQSDPAWWQTGLFDSADWKARWIQPAYPSDDPAHPSPL